MGGGQGDAGLRGDLRVGQAGDRGDLTLEPGDEGAVVREAPDRHLDGDASAFLPVPRLEHPGHPAGTDGPDDLVAVVQPLPDRGQGATAPTGHDGAVTTASSRSATRVTRARASHAPLLLQRSVPAPSRPPAREPATAGAFAVRVEW